MAQVIGEPVELDTTQVSGSNNNKIYTNLYSEDKQYLMAVKINTKNPKTFIFTTFLFDKNLELAGPAPDHHAGSGSCRLFFKF